MPVEGHDEDESGNEPLVFVKQGLATPFRKRFERQGRETPGFRNPQSKV